MISEELEISIQNAFEMAKLKKHEFLTLEHLMLALCKDEEIKAQRRLELGMLFIIILIVGFL